jgi:hypothetical protein
MLRPLTPGSASRPVSTTRKFSPLPGFDYRTFQPVASRCSDWNIPSPHQLKESRIIFCIMTALWCNSTYLNMEHWRKDADWRASKCSEKVLVPLWPAPTPHGMAWYPTQFCVMRGRPVTASAKARRNWFSVLKQRDVTMNIVASDGSPFYTGTNVREKTALVFSTWIPWKQRHHIPRKGQYILNEPQDVTFHKYVFEWWVGLAWLIAWMVSGAGMGNCVNGKWGWHG